MYAVAQALEVSDVKMALSSPHIFSDMLPTIDDLRVLDHLRVRIGPTHVDERGDDKGEIQRDEAPILSLTLAVPPCD